MSVDSIPPRHVVLRRLIQPGPPRADRVHPGWRGVAAAAIALLVSTVLGGTSGAQESTVAATSQVTGPADQIQVIDGSQEQAAGTSQILIAPYPPVVGEEVTFAVPAAVGEATEGRHRLWGLTRGPSDLPTGSYWAQFQSGFTTRLIGGGTHAVTLNDCARSFLDDDCTTVATRTFEVGTINTRPDFDLTLTVPPEDAIFRGEPISVEVNADGADVASAFFGLDRSTQTGVVESATDLITPADAGDKTLTAAVCFNNPSQTCEVLHRDLTVERPGTGTAQAPAAPIDLTIRGAAEFDTFQWKGTNTIRWTDTNRLESGYRVMTGPSPDQLTLVGDYPRDTTGIPRPDGHQCVQVRVIYDNQFGPPAARCTSDPEVAEGPDLAAKILTVPAQPVAGERVTFYVASLDQGWFEPHGFNRMMRSKTLIFGDGARSDGGDDWYVHTYDRPGTYVVSAPSSCPACVDGETFTRTITVVSPADVIAEPVLAAPRNVELFENSGTVTFADTNDDEDGYVVTNLGAPDGYWIGQAGRNATSASAPTWIDNYGDGGSAECVEVRAVKDNVLGPATTSCDYTFGGDRAGSDTKMEAGRGPGHLTAHYTTAVRNNSPHNVRIGAVDLDALDPESNSRDSYCSIQMNEFFGDYAYETGAAGIDLERTYTVEFDGLTIGHTYAIGFSYQYDNNGATHDRSLREEYACTPHSPGVIVS